MGGFLRMSAMLAVMAILGDWCSSAQAQEAKPALPVPVPAPPGPLGYRSCLEMRESLEGALYMSFKGTLPRRMLKELLPGLVEPLLPVMCLQSGSNARKWMQQHQDLKLSALRPRLSRPKRQLNMFLPFLGGFTLGGPAGGGKVKDPGDLPPPGTGGGPNPFKDPGDRPMTFFGRPMRKIKDPQDRPPPPPGEAAPVDPMMQSMMSMMRLMNFQRMMNRMNSRPGGGGGGRGGGGNGNAGTGRRF